MSQFIETLRRLIRSDRATSAVEFALVTPLFLAMVLGIVVFGSHLTIIHGVQQLAAEAARKSVAGLNDGERSDLALGYVAANVASYPLLSADRVRVEAAPSAGDANVYVVTVNYDASQLPLYSLPFVPGPSPFIARSAAIPRGGF